MAKNKKPWWDMTFEEKERYNRELEIKADIGKTISMGLGAIICFLMLWGMESCSSSKGTAPQVDPEIKDADPMTLVSKVQTKESARLNFDTDGNTNTTEVVISRNAPFSIVHDRSLCPEQTAKIFSAQIGKTQSVAAWTNDLFCTKCVQRDYWSVKRQR